MAEVKYVAAGFLNDAERLLLDFMSENSMEFPAFARVWKRHNFSLVYAGRANGRELREFTFEIYQLSINFLKSSSLLYQVGGTFLLYALYRNQILSPPMKIRIISSQFKTVLALLDVSRAKNNHSLLYVISYLVKNAFEFAACSKLKGPNSIGNEIHKDGDEYHPKFQESDIKHEMIEIAKNNVLLEVDQLFTQYEKGVHSLNMPSVDVTSKYSSFKDLACIIDELLNENKTSHQDLNGKDAESLPCETKKNSAIGSRRALLKAAAFSHPACHYLSHGENNATTSCVSEGIESAVEVPSKTPVPTTAIRKKRRVRRCKRKAGRPKKFLSDDSMSEEELLPNPNQNVQEKGLSGRRRRPRGPQFAKIRHYYAEDFVDWDDPNAPSTSNCVPKEYLFSSNSDCSEKH